jgi:hypothetical protein
LRTQQLEDLYMSVVVRGNPTVAHAASAS